jgi:hypothetical protein
MRSSQATQTNLINELIVSDGARNGFQIHRLFGGLLLATEAGGLDVNECMGG